MAVKKVDTKVFEDAIDNINGIKSLYDQSKEDIISKIEGLLDDWSGGTAQHKFYVYFSSFKDRLNVDMQMFDYTLSLLTACKDAYEGADEALAEMFKQQSENKEVNE